ncbi:MAG TPA: aldehyde dehydrogenase family protein [Acidimicrobiales bacterium]|nr:aldehyde dehydrogenase family protein [Acidimicrobiales bacterium]
MTEHRHVRALVGAEWRDGAGTFPATSPGSGEVFATIEEGDAALADAAVRAAAGAAAGWARVAPAERAAHLHEIERLVGAQREELAVLLTRDQGKPLEAEAAFDEVDELAEYFSMAAEDAKRTAGAIPPSVTSGRRVLVQRVPLGVVGVVSPWNWPYTMGAEVFAPAMAAGNTVVGSQPPARARAPGSWQS